MAREDWYPTREQERTRPRTRVAREEEPLAEELESERRISLDEEEESPFLRHIVCDVLEKANVVRYKTSGRRRCLRRRGKAAGRVHIGSSRMGVVDPP